jgi:YHS domain-containing protein
MNAIISFSAVALFAGTLYLTHTKAPVTNFSNHSVINADTPGKKINLAIKTDPVCGMSVENHYGDTTMYNNKVYGFCGKMCKKDFIKNPKKYIKN